MHESGGCCVFFGFVLCVTRRPSNSYGGATTQQQLRSSVCHTCVYMFGVSYAADAGSAEGGGIACVPWINAVR